MCEFCHKHGEGKKWYLQAKNYSDDLLSDITRRELITSFFTAPGGKIPPTSPLGRVNAVNRRLPTPLRGVLRPYARRLVKNTYCHQVLPIEDVEQVFSFLGSIVRMPCYCRQKKRAKEQRYCYSLSLAPEGGELFKILEGIDKSYLKGPDNLGLERLTREQALANFRQYEQEGVFHAVFLFKEPFVAGMCNCDRADCMQMQTAAMANAPIIFRSEYIASLNPEACNGCRACMRACQFGAIGYSMANKKAYIDQQRCYGCGVCRASCAQGALKLLDRASVPAVANLW